MMDDGNLLFFYGYHELYFFCYQLYVPPIMNFSYFVINYVCYLLSLFLDAIVIYGSGLQK